MSAPLTPLAKASSQVATLQKRIEALIEQVAELDKKLR